MIERSFYIFFNSFSFQRLLAQIFLQLNTFPSKHRINIEPKQKPFKPTKKQFRYTKSANFTEHDLAINSTRPREKTANNTPIASDYKFAS